MANPCGQPYFTGSIQPLLVDREPSVIRMITVVAKRSTHAMLSGCFFWAKWQPHCKIIAITSSSGWRMLAVSFAIPRIPINQPSDPCLLGQNRKSVKPPLATNQSHIHCLSLIEAQWISMKLRPREKKICAGIAEYASLSGHWRASNCAMAVFPKTNQWHAMRYLVKCLEFLIAAGLSNIDNFWNREQTALINLSQLTHLKQKPLLPLWAR